MITFTPLSVPWAASSTATVAKATTEPGTSAYGPHEIESPRALAYLLEMDDARILVDCGAPETFQFPAVEELEAAASDDEPGWRRKARSRALDDVLEELGPTIDLVLLSHSTLSHLGLYAYAFARLGLRCPCYSTLPVQTMGRLTTLEAAEGLRSERDMRGFEKRAAPIKSKGKVKVEQPAEPGVACVPTAAEIEEAFENVAALRYLQPTALDGKCAGLTLTAYAAGHSLGGTLWKIRSPSSGTILVCLDWNHNRERHIDGTALIATAGGASGQAGSSTGGVLDAVRRSDLMITEVERGLIVNPRRKDRDSVLLDIVHNTIRSGHSVLFPVDASARLLELLVLLDQHWAYAYPNVRFPLVLISRTGKEVLERAKTLMEWMTREWATSETGGGDADETAAARARRERQQRHQAPTSPLDFRFLRIFSSLSAMDEAMPVEQAKVILAVPLSLTHGTSRKLLARFAADPASAILLTQRGEAGSLARSLWDKWASRQTGDQRWGKGKVGVAITPDDECNVEIHDKVALKGAELEAHMEEERVRKEKEAAQKALLARSRRRLEADQDEEGGEDDEDDDEDDDDDDDESDGEGGPSRKRKRGAMDDGEGGGGGPLMKMGKAETTDEALDSGEVSFDIFLRGKARRATTFFGAAGSAKGAKYGVGARYRMFPVVERKKRIDAYGETVDVSRWLSRGRKQEAEAALKEEAEAAGFKSTADAVRARLAAQQQKEKAAAEAAAAVPTKFVAETLLVQLKCRVAFVDMEGLNDGRALKLLVPQLIPRRLFLVNGDAATRESLLSAFKAMKAMTNDVYAPLLAQPTQIGELTSAFTLNLGEGLLASLELSAYEDFEVAQVKGRVKYPSEGLIPTLEGGDAESDGPETQQSSGLVVFSGPSRKQNVPGTIFIGDLKLSTLKGTLSSSHRMPSEFAGEGTLVCGAGVSSASPGTSAVMVRKQGQGRIVIEGNLGRGFYSVRDAVYELHARVRGA